MDNLDDSENNAKISDSAYSNSCSNSQSRRSHSSKSTRSGSNSSGSSGYGGKPSTSGYSSNNQSQPTEKRSKDKDAKKKKPLQNIQTDLQGAEVKNVIECIPEIVPVFESSKEEINDVPQIPTPGLAQIEKVPDLMEVSDRNSGKDELDATNPHVDTPIALVTSRPSSTTYDGFSCVISLQDGIVMYTTASITTALGFPKDMWIGRSFIDFVHQRDRSTFASQITNGLTAPKFANGTQTKAPDLGDQVSTMICRIRRYKGLNIGFGIRDRVVTFMPFLLKFFFKNMNEDDGQVIYLVIQASPLFSAFKTPNEIVTNSISFVMRHSPSGRLDYIDPESVPYLGYLPQDIVEKDALQLYHPSDLMYLLQVYENIVRQGAEPRSKPYRMMAQNGDYLKLETEWTSFINPWSRKLEFVIGKHFILEGPTNPDVFQTPEFEKGYKKPTEEETKSQALRDNIIRIMNEVLTKPAEAAKQQMSKRCQDLASFMESLLEETPKPEEELRLDIQDADHSCFERDSVMLGGISPHHEYNDSNTSTETTLSYNQLNYNENLQRYFDCHEPHNMLEETNDLTVCEHGSKSESQEPGEGGSKYISATNNKLSESYKKANTSDSNAIPSTSRVDSLCEYPALRLTESLLNKHNIEMEKELVKKHRETRSSTKGEREKATTESRLKKKEHLARCNAFFQPTTAGLSTEYQPHGLKRASKNVEEGSTHKHRCSSPRTPRRRLGQKINNNTPLAATSEVPSPWAPNPVNNAYSNNNNMNSFILGLGIPPQMPVMSSMMPGVVPMYYTPPSNQLMPRHVHYRRYQNGGNFNPHVQYMHQGHMNKSDMAFQMNSVFTTSPNGNRVNTNDVPRTQFQPQPQNNQMQYMMLGQAVYGSPFMYSTINPQVSYTLQQSFLPQQAHNAQPLGLSNRNYEEACKVTMASKYFENMGRTNIPDRRPNNVGIARGMGNSSIGASNRSADTMTDERILNRKSQMDNSDSTNEKTDGESSSSFYSSFFKTDSGSNEESDSKNQSQKDDKSPYILKTNATSLKSPDGVAMCVLNERKIPRRKIDPPWIEQVSVTSELIYKYQICTKNIEEVLSSDKEKLKQLEQPSLVNEQLSQLYLDLQLEGVAARLTLEEGITSSSSSGEETTTKSTKSRRRKREYSRLVMIYEEDAPLPPPDDITYTS